MKQVFPINKRKVTNIAIGITLLYAIMVFGIILSENSVKRTNSNIIELVLLVLGMGVVLFGSAFFLSYNIEDGQYFYENGLIKRGGKVPINNITEWFLGNGYRGHPTLYITYLSSTGKKKTKSYWSLTHYSPKTIKEISGIIGKLNPEIKFGMTKDVEKWLAREEEQENKLAKKTFDANKLVRPNFSARVMALRFLYSSAIAIVLGLILPVTAKNNQLVGKRVGELPDLLFLVYFVLIIFLLSFFLPFEKQENQSIYGIVERVPDNSVSSSNESIPSFPNKMEVVETKLSTKRKVTLWIGIGISVLSVYLLAYLVRRTNWSMLAFVPILGGVFLTSYSLQDGNVKGALKTVLRVLLFFVVMGILSVLRAVYHF